MVSVLLAAARVPSRRLQMPVRDRADPHLRPRGGNRERADTPQLIRIAQRPAVGADIHEPRSGATPPDAGHVVGDVAETRRLRRLDWIDDGRWRGHRNRAHTPAGP